MTTHPATLAPKLATTSSANTPPRHSAWRTAWQRGKPVLTWVFFGLVLWLLVNQAREIEWGEVVGAVRRQPLTTLAAACGLAAASHLLYSCFDLLGRRYTGHTVPVPTVMATTFVSYAFNLNLGSLIGGLAFRYRLYSRLGLDTATITRVVSVSMLTNWLGYLLLAGAVFLWRPFELPRDWALGSGALQVLGGVLVTLALAYVLLCAVSPRRQWQLRGHTLQLPGGRMAGLQLLMSSANWLLMGGVVYLLLQQRVDYPTVLGVLLVAAIAGVITHVPAGLGVLEAVFVALLAGQLPKNELLAALLIYRAVYYLAPLLLAVGVHLLLEARVARAGSPATD